MRIKALGVVIVNAPFIKSPLPPRAFALGNGVLGLAPGFRVKVPAYPVALSNRLNVCLCLDLVAVLMSRS